jgi:mannose-6-phosphate isomerase class I
MRAEEILFLTPVFTHAIWGGTRLRDEFGYQVKGDDIGECWGIAAHEKGDCIVERGAYKGKKLSELWRESPELFGNMAQERFPLLTKIIDAKEDLSIQVHPGDAYAREHENGSSGKTECWYILDCREDATIVVGHNAKNREELQDMIRGGRWSDFIREVPIKRGSFIQIDPGTVHAIKGGTMLLETQQNSDITYRVYDYDRLSDGKPRELHVEQSLDVITVPAKKTEGSVIDTTGVPQNQWNALIACDFYRVWKLNLNGDMKFRQELPFMLMSIVNGNGMVNGIPVQKGSHMILPSGFGEVTLSGSMEIIASAVA